MLHFQNFDKIDSFLKPVLNILILVLLIVGWGEGFIKKGASILHQIHRFRGRGMLIVRGVGFIKIKVGIFRTLSNF